MKFKSEFGASASTDVIAGIEKHIARIQQKEVKQLPLNDALKSGLIEYLDLSPSYFQQIARLVDLDAIQNAGLKIVVDPMYGAGIGYIKMLLANGKTQITEINGNTRE